MSARLSLRFLPHARAHAQSFFSPAWRTKSVDSFELVSRSSVAVITREDVGSLQTSNFRFFRMQKELLSNEFNQSGCIQNDPVLHKLFEDAIAVLRLAGADDNSVGKN